MSCVFVTCHLCGRVVAGTESRLSAWQPAAFTSLLERCGMCRTLKECDGGVFVAQPLSACWLRPEAAHGGAV